MKKYIALALMFILSSMTAAVSAEGTTTTKMEDREPIAYDFDFSVTEEAGMVEANWNAFDGEGFEWFKLVYSTTNKTPLYPTDTTVFVGNKDQLTKTFKLQK